MQIGNYLLRECVVDSFGLDGGAMFGSVPKTIWSTKIAADDRNRINLVSRIVVLDHGSRRILVDLGCGQKWSEKFKEIYNFKRVSAKPLQQIISGVTDVIITHLHFDHIGGVSYYDGAELKLCFPDAMHYLQRRNWQISLNPGPRETATYLSENIEPLKNAKLKLLDGNCEVLPSIFVCQSDGHTQGLQWVKIVSGKNVVALPSELVPTAHHLPLPYVMGYDLCAETTINDKTALLEQAAREKWLLVFGHDSQTAACRTEKDDKGRFVALEPTKLESII